MFTGRNALFLKAGIALAVVWGIVWGAFQVTGNLKPTPEKLVAFAEENRLSEIDDSEKRRRVIGKVASMLNQMEPAELRRLAEETGEDPRREFFEEMNPEEQRFFMEKRIGKAFEQMMTAFNEMEREERKQVVERTLKQMRSDNARADGLERLEETDPELVDRIVNEGLKAYYQSASAETKLDLAPVLEEMQKNLAFSRDRRPK
jgi:hypothetical protein